MKNTFTKYSASVETKTARTVLKCVDQLDKLEAWAESDDNCYYFQDEVVEVVSREIKKLYHELEQKNKDIENLKRQVR